MDIKNSTTEDINEIFRLYRLASQYQRSKKSVVVWPEFERQLVATEIAEGRQWKLVIESKIACIWTITFSDEQIWEEKNTDPAMYIHRIAANPDFRGNHFINPIVTWAKEYAKAKNKSYVRLDTLGNNVKLIAHYTSAGFTCLGMFNMKNTSSLPEHYQNMPVSLFEIAL